MTDFIWFNLSNRASSILNSVSLNLSKVEQRIFKGDPKILKQEQTKFWVCHYAWCWSPVPAGAPDSEVCRLCQQGAYSTGSALLPLALSACLAYCSLCRSRSSLSLFLPMTSIRMSAGATASGTCRLCQAGTYWTGSGWCRGISVIMRLKEPVSVSDLAWPWQGVGAH